MYRGSEVKGRWLPATPSHIARSPCQTGGAVSLKFGAMLMETSGEGSSAFYVATEFFNIAFADLPESPSRFAPSLNRGYASFAKLRCVLLKASRDVSPARLNIAAKCLKIGSTSVANP